MGGVKEPERMGDIRLWKSELCLHSPDPCMVDPCTTVVTNLTHALILSSVLTLIVSALLFVAYSTKPHDAIRSRHEPSDREQPRSNFSQMGRSSTASEGKCAWTVSHECSRLAEGRGLQCTATSIDCCSPGPLRYQWQHKKLDRAKWWLFHLRGRHREFTLLFSTGVKRARDECKHIVI